MSLVLSRGKLIIAIKHPKINPQSNTHNKIITTPNKICNIFEPSKGVLMTGNLNKLDNIYTKPRKFDIDKEIFLL